MSNVEQTLSIIKPDAVERNLGEDIKAKINEDMYLINRIQNNRENFTNKKDETYFLYLLLSLGIVTALVLFKK